MDSEKQYHFDYIKPSPETAVELETARVLYKDMLDYLLSRPACRERALAITKLEESLMYCTKSIVVTSGDV